MKQECRCERQEFEEDSWKVSGLDVITEGEENEEDSSLLPDKKLALRAGKGPTRTMAL